MKQMLIIELDSKKIEKIKVANTFVARFKGLMGQEEMIGYNGLLITKCNSIHTFFMKMDIDVVFLSKDNQVIKVLRNLAPWRMTRIYWKADKVLELAAHTIPEGVKEGDRVEVKEYV